MKLMSTLTKLLAGAAVVAMTGVSAIAADKTLTISSWAPPSHGINAILWPKVIEMIETATDGRVSGEIKYKLGSPPAQIDLVQDGAADISWIFHGYTPGRFVATKMIELPGYEGNAEAASVAYWRAHEKYFAKADEHKGVKVIALMTHGPGLLHSDRKVTKLDEINGMKLRIGGGVSGDVGAALGATGIRVPAPKVYETLASNAADGVMMPMEGKKGFKLTEVAKHTYAVPGGFYRGSFAVIMNEDAFAGLSEKDRAALEKVFGEPMSKVAGAVWDEIDAAGQKASVDALPDFLTEASAEDAAKYKEMSGPIIEKVLGEVSGKGIDAKAAMDFIAAEMKSM